MYVEKKLRKLLMDWWIVPLAFSSSKLLDIVFWLYILGVYVIAAVQMTSCIVQKLTCNRSDSGYLGIPLVRESDAVSPLLTSLCLAYSDWYPCWYSGW